MQKQTVMLFALLCFVTQLFAQGPNNSGTYYQAADGKKGKGLKTALHGVISKHKTISYDGLWSCYHTTDKRADGKLWDMYSNTTNYTIGGPEQGRSYSKEGDGYNREHSMPKSWFKEAPPMKSDLVHVVPTDGYVNNRRGNDPFGETNGEIYKSNGGFCKFGVSTIPGFSKNVFEPADEYKGDFARIYFYMATCYEDKIAGWSSPMLAGNAYPAYTDWAIKMLLRWAKNDPVSEKEINRNNEVYKLQGNRNPFVDYPGLEQLVWGDKQNVAFDYDNYDATAPNPDPDPDPNPDPDPEPDPNPDPDPVGDAQIYKMVSSTADLQAGVGYLIVCEEAQDGLKVAMAASGSDVRSYAEVSVSNGTITTLVNEEGKPRQIILGGTSGAYTLYDAVEKVYLSLTKDDNKLHSSSEATTDNAKWSVSFSGATAKIANNAYPNRAISYNSGSPRFACYKSTSGQKPVKLYKNVTPTGIGQVPAEVVNGQVTVYGLTGVALRKNVNRTEALKGLPRGIYIIGGRKYVVR